MVLLGQIFDRRRARRVHLKAKALATVPFTRAEINQDTNGIEVILGLKEVFNVELLSCKL
ncbi:MAG TPA: hypothetical protein DCE31_08100 [Lautropia sp.]|nr:hypothetical protein [Lautropia sp.]